MGLAATPEAKQSAATASKRRGECISMLSFFLSFSSSAKEGMVMTTSFFFFHLLSFFLCLFLVFFFFFFTKGVWRALGGAAPVLYSHLGHESIWGTINGGMWKVKGKKKGGGWLASVKKGFFVLFSFSGQSHSLSGSLAAIPFFYILRRSWRESSCCLLSRTQRWKNAKNSNLKLKIKK